MSFMPNLCSWENLVFVMLQSCVLTPELAQSSHSNLGFWLNPVKNCRKLNWVIMINHQIDSNGTSYSRSFTSNSGTLWRIQFARNSTIWKSNFRRIIGKTVLNKLVNWIHCYGLSTSTKNGRIIIVGFLSLAFSIY